GAGGHSREILKQIRPEGLLIGLDRDPMMLQFAANALDGSPHELILEQGSYIGLPRLLERLGISQIDRVLADLGLSSDQLTDASRGFSFHAEGALDLRFDVSSGEPAADWVNRASVEELTEAFREWGEEPHARRIAQAIVDQRRTMPLQTAHQLAELVAQVVSFRGESSRHPATRIFQALRIAVNDELRHVSELMQSVLPQCLATGGRAAILTFHSLEDRIVKQAFQDKSRWRPVTKKPVTASAVEKRQNPRSRSAKLRVAVRL
ncbi:MAG: 16S rRNA (cytosine(1402)-N(4))-methyltransferase RsmH, partial [Planctomycetaceae bacterium]|nr:16S rRNA (cytosine(1402)-N(4))-methyltransferase RsmH [Planctomycetaceae bacterium]